MTESTGQLSFFNWSINKLLSTEVSSFNKAKIKILLIILLFSILKVAIAIPIMWHHAQYKQLTRASILFAIYFFLTKLILAKRLQVTQVTHILICVGLLVISSNIFIMAHHVNIVTLQFVFMLSISSFYLLSIRYGVLYSGIAMSIIIFYLFFVENATLQLNFSSEIITKDVGYIITVINFITILISHYLFHQAFQINIIEKELLNKKLQEAVELANKNAQSKANFLSTMSHELRTPLNSVIGMTEVLLHDTKEPDKKKNLEFLRFSAESLHTLINDILDFNKFDSNKVQLEKVSVNLYSLIKNICAGLEFQAKEKGLEIILIVDEAIKSQNVITDPLRITQIIYNLIGNGIKFTHKGSITVSLSMSELNHQHMKVRFSIVDTGIGISNEKHKEIFEPFVQATSTTARRFGGTGLGLAIVKQLLTLFKSTIHIESNIGKGSTFYFDINFSLDHSTEIVTNYNTVQQNEIVGLKVLIAEDNPINVYLIDILSKRWQLELDVAENGKEVLALFEANTYDVILMDIYMPDMDGYEASKKIRAYSDVQKSKIPIIAVSATAQSDLTEDIYSVGINDYVHKPFNALELYDKLKKYKLQPTYSLTQVE